MLLIGLDAASRPENTAIAIAEIEHNKINIRNAYQLKKDDNPSLIINDHIADEDNVILGIDAPLGWTKPLSDSLKDHKAGMPMMAENNELFRRQTDQFIKKKIRKSPLEVGADRISRTAVSALKTLQGLRKLGHRLTIPMEQVVNKGINVLEVYPGGILKVIGETYSGYKGKSTAERLKRLEIIEHITGYFSNLEVFDDARDSSDILDAIICLIGAKDFFDKKCYEPIDRKISEIEGWIWIRKAIDNV